MALKLPMRSSAVDPWDVVACVRAVELDMSNVIAASAKANTIKETLFVS